MIVKYKKEKYECKVIDWIIVSGIEIKLFFKRIFRLLRIVFRKQDMFLYMIITGLWLSFAWFSYVVAPLLENNDVTYLTMLWNCRNNIFTSAILAFAVSSYNRIRDYRTDLRKQHYLYVDSMCDFEEPIRSNIQTNIWCYFYITYNRNCFTQTCNDYEEEIEKIDINSSDFVHSINSIKESVNKIEQTLKMGQLILKDDKMLEHYLKLIKEEVQKFNMDKRKLKKDKNVFDIKNFLEELYGVVEELRYPWRRDESDDLKIITILNKYENNGIKNDFYMRMKLENFSLDWVRNECAEMENAFGPLKIKD